MIARVGQGCPARGIRTNVNLFLNPANFSIRIDRRTGMLVSSFDP